MFANRFVVNQLKRTDEMTVLHLQLMSADPKWPKKSDITGKTVSVSSS